MGYSFFREFLDSSVWIFLLVERRFPPSYLPAGRRGNNEAGRGSGENGE